MSYKNLLKTVIRNKLCCFCGACVAVCPENCLTFSGEGPKLEKSCAECGRCITACPGFGVPLTQLTEAVFNRDLTQDEEDNGLGHIIHDRNLVSADPEVLANSYTGGKVTTLLSYLLETGEIDGAVVTTCGSSTPYPHFSWPRIAKTKTDLLNCAGSKYMFSPNLLLLKDVAENDNLRSIAFLGMGCHVMGIRKLQLLGPEYKHLVEKISYVFGLFCGGSMLSHDNYLSLVAKLCNVQVEDIATIDFRRIHGEKQFMVEYEVGLKNGDSVKSTKILIDDYFYKMVSTFESWNRCRLCMDYSAEFADISFGSTHIISRTEIGEQLMQNVLSKGIMVHPNDPFGDDFVNNAKRTDIAMIRLKKKYNPRRIRKNIKKQRPVPEY